MKDANGRKERTLDRIQGGRKEKAKPEEKERKALARELAL